MGRFSSTSQPVCFHSALVSGLLPLTLFPCPGYNVYAALNLTLIQLYIRHVRLSLSTVHRLLFALFRGLCDLYLVTI